MPNKFWWISTAGKPYHYYNIWGINIWEESQQRHLFLAYDDFLKDEGLSSGLVTIQRP